MKLFLYRVAMVALLNSPSFSIAQSRSIEEAATLQIVAKWEDRFTGLYKAAFAYEAVCGNAPEIKCKNCTKRLPYYEYLGALLGQTIQNLTKDPSSFSVTEAFLSELEGLFLKKNSDAVAAFIIQSLEGDKKIMDYSCNSVSCHNKELANAGWQYQKAAKIKIKRKNKG